MRAVRDRIRRLFGGGDASSSRMEAPPAGTPAELLARIWSEVLGVSEVAPEDDFFALGGHSLLATQVVARLQERLGLELPVRALFEAPTVALLAAAIEAGTYAAGVGEVPPIRPFPRFSDRFPLSFAQQRLWFLDRLEPGAGYNVAQGVILEGPLDVSALLRSLEEVVRRHEALRTTFVTDEEGEPVQVIGPAGFHPLPVIALDGLTRREAEAEAERLAAAEASRPFDLARGPMLRTTLLRMGLTEHRLVLVVHHIASDGWSMGVLLREAGAMYRAFSRGAGSPLPELPLQYLDYALWHRHWMQGEVLASELDHWRSRLEDRPAILELPVDRLRPAVRSGRGGRRPVALPLETSARLDAIGREERATSFMILLGAFQTLLHRYSGQDDILVGSPIAGRRRTETEGLIGFFTNTLVLRLDLKGTPSFREVVSRTRAATLEAYAHQDLPFERLVEALQPERDLSVQPFFQVLFVLQNAPMDPPALEGLRLDLWPLHTGTAKFDLTLDLTETGEGLRGWLEYDADLFDPATAERLLGHFQRLLEAGLAEPEWSVSGLPLLSGRELAQILGEWNATAADPDIPDSLLPFFDDQVLKTPRRAAVVYDGESLAYEELADRVHRLACHLRDLGVGPDVPVGVYLDRSLELVVAVLGVLKAGGGYLPLDPAYPHDRLAFMLEDSGVGVVLTRERLAESLPAGATRVIRLDSDWTEITGRSARPLPDFPGLSGRLAYLIYTSGSTGRPKGVAMSHGALVNLMAYQIQRSHAAPRTLQFSALSFDVSCQEMFSTWGAGGTLFMVSEHVRRDPGALLDFIAAQRIERLFLPFVALRQLAEAAEERQAQISSLREVITAGEALQVTPAVANWLTRTGACRLDNQYGPSETHIVTAHGLTGDPGAWPALPPIGHPVSGVLAYVLDRLGQPAPIGVTGELYLGGACLARNYLGHPAATAERFVPDPFSGIPGGRLYRTGDVARWRAEGVLDFLGRVDHQVKIRGFRVEPGEIEAVLAEDPGVRQAVVTVRDDLPGGRGLVAFVVPDGGAVPSVSALRGFLRQRLPDYMVPGHFAFLDRFPVTPSGKVDRRSLSRLQVLSDATEPAGEEVPAADRSPAEELLEGIFAELLQVERVSSGQSFFDLGGHSLLATRLVSRLRAVFGVELPVRAVFEAPTVSALAARMELERGEGSGPGAPPLLPAARPRQLPLSFAQERLWFLHQLDPDSPAYNLAYWVELAGPLSRRALEHSLAEILRRHEALRTTFPTAEGGPFQAVAPAGDVTLPLVDLTPLAGGVDAEVGRLAVEEAGAGFDLGTGPLARFCLLRTGKERHHFLCTLHHIVADGWSMEILLRELVALYSAFAEDRPSPLSGLAVQYADFAIWQRERWNRGELRGQLDFWRERLAGVPPLELPADGRRDNAGIPRAAIQPLTLPFELGSAVASLGLHQGTTRFMSFLAALQALFGRLSGQEDFALGSPVASREHPGIEGLIGFFVNTLVLRCDLSDDPPFATHLERVRAAALDAYQNQELPFEKLVEELQPERRFGQSPLFQVLFAFQGEVPRVPPTPGLRWTFHPPLATMPKFDLSIVLQEEDGRVTGFFEYRADLFSPAAVQRLGNGFQTLLTAVVDDPRRRIGELPLLAPSELEEVLATGRGTASSYPREATLPELFGEWVENTPDAVALSWSEGDLTYRELDRRANRAAWRLRKLGVGPEVPVALCAERSPGLVVGMVGILKAGGFYVPLDPDYPEERLAFMLEDSGAPVIVRLEHLTGRLPETAAREVVLTAEGEVRDGRPNAAEAVPLAGISAGNLAYVMYTSGSTGRPKGVGVVHRGIVRLVRGADYAVFDPSQTLLQTSTPSFDAATFEIWGALLNGGRLALMPPGIPSPAELTIVMVRHGVTSMMLTAALFHQLTEHGLGGIPSLRQAFSAGDVLAPAAMRRAAADLPGCRMINAYGPTENTVLTCCYELNDPDELGTSVPLGRSIANTRVYILDRHLQPLPTGVPGELFAAGDGLARGYWRRPALSAERFLPDPWSPEPGGRMYRTGDRVRYNPAGEVELLGRLDHQVKIRGFRIEPGEIEGVLLQHPAVRDAVVKPQSHQTGGDKYLVAYVAAEGEELPASGDLRAFLGSRLPAYMVPAWFVVLRELPLTPNAKVDRGALQLPRDLRESDRADFVAPRSMVEQMIADIWARVLQLERVGAFDSFFELGGHSLNATQVVSQLREELGIEVPLRTLFQAPTMADLAVALLRQMAQEAGEDALILDADECGEPDSRAAVQNPLGES